MAIICAVMSRQTSGLLLCGHCAVQSCCFASTSIASYADALWARHAIFLPHERLLKRAGTFLTLCSKRSAGEHVEITKQPIGAWLLFNRNPQRVINYPSLLITYGKQIPNPCFMCGRNFEKNRRKQLFSMQFSVNPSGENKSVWQGFSGYRTLN